MSSKKSKTISSFWIFLFLATLETSCQSYVEGLRSLDKSIFGPKPKGTIKTIEALEVNDIIDCVDIYKQPAFENLLIKELKMAPSSIQIDFNETSNPQPKLVQTWHKYGECPTGTIPIRRTSNNNSTIYRKYHNDPDENEYATMIQDFRSHGGKASFNLWNPRVMRIDEFSLAQLWAVTQDSQGDPEDTVEAGWMVYPLLFRDARTRLFIFWSHDHYRFGCYNLLCVNGFVHTNRHVAIGGSLEPVSVYNGTSNSRSIGLSRSHVGDWWLMVQGQIVGYFPRRLFTRLGDGADRIDFGGEVINLATDGRHTSTTMGSGHFSAEGYQRAGLVSNIKVLDDHQFHWVEPNLRVLLITRPRCYDLTIGPNRTDLGTHFYYGGPGLSPQCL